MNPEALLDGGGPVLSGFFNRRSSRAPFRRLLGTALSDFSSAVITGALVAESLVPVPESWLIFVVSCPYSPLGDERSEVGL